MIGETGEDVGLVPESGVLLERIQRRCCAHWCVLSMGTKPRINDPTSYRNTQHENDKFYASHMDTVICRSSSQLIAVEEFSDEEETPTSMMSPRRNQQHLTEDTESAEFTASFAHSGCPH